MDSDEIRAVETEAALDEILRLPRVLLYKHSTRCGSSRRAMLEVERFARAAPGIPVCGIDVIRHREISDQAATRLGVEHQSPQVILIEEGRPVWSASHFHITAESLEEAVADRIRSQPQ